MSLGLLLKAQYQNPHATLITLSRTGVTQGETAEELAQRKVAAEKHHNALAHLTIDGENSDHELLRSIISHLREKCYNLSDCLFQDELELTAFKDIYYEGDAKVSIIAVPFLNSFPPSRFLPEARCHRYQHYYKDW